MFKFDLQLFADNGSTQGDVYTPPAGIAAEDNPSPYSKAKIDATHEKVRDGVYERIEAPCASSTFGSNLMVLGFHRYLGGTKMRKYNPKLSIKLAELTHVCLDKIKLNIDVVYVPDTRVWRNAKKFAAQKVNSFTPPPSVMPSAIVPSMLQIDMPNGFTSGYVETTLYRHSVAHQYFGWNIPIGSVLNVLPIRGYRAAYNDIFLPKELGSGYVEWDGDTPNSTEVNTYFRHGQTGASASHTITGPQSEVSSVAQDSCYYTSYRRTLYRDNDPVDNTNLFTHDVTQRQIDEFRSQSQNAELTDEQIISQIRGTRTPNENICRIIGSKRFDIDMTLNPAQSESGLSLGADGAFSLTELDVDIDLRHFEAPLDGFIHVFYSFTAPNSAFWSSGIARELTDVSWDSDYRPDFKNIKDDVIFERELTGLGGSNWDRILGYVQRHSKHFRLHPLVNGDFIQNNNQLGSNPRSPAKGFVAPSIDGTDTVSLVSRKDWGLLQSPQSNPNGSNNPLYNKYDNLAILMRFMLLFNGGNLRLRDYLMRMPHCFFLYGTQAFELSQPIDDAVKRKFIPFGGV